MADWASAARHASTGKQRRAMWENKKDAQRGRTADKVRSIASGEAGKESEIKVLREKANNKV